MSAVDVIRKLQATNSRLDKEQILLDAWIKGERDFFKGAQLAYDILVSFGVKKVAEVSLDEGEEDNAASFTFDGFIDLANKLATRKLTGHAARDVINASALACNTAMWNEFYRRVLLKDLKCGVTDTTINKILNKLAKSDPVAHDYLVPVWSCQLAHDGAKEENVKRVKGRKMLDVKLDGVRLLTIVDKEAGTVTQYTRNGEVNENFPHIRAAFEPLLTDSSLLPCSMVFDGEITSKSFQQLMKQVNRKEKVDSAHTKLALFDIVPLADFKSGVCNMAQSDRHTALCGVIGMMLHLSGEAYVVPKITVDLDTKEGYQAFLEFNKEAIEAGYEGIMVKDPDAPYECKRSYAWLKIKPVIEVSLTAKKFKYGEKGTKNEFVMGAVLFEGEDDDKEVSVWCGGGWSDEDRKDICANWPNYEGLIGEVKADCFSLEDGATVYSLRFPRFKGWRGSKPGEKL